MKICFPLTVVLISVLALLAFNGSALADVIYVDCDAEGEEDGTSWEDAFTTITDGLDEATSGDEVWVAQGNYTENITLKAGVSLLGGFAGSGSTRDWNTWVTTIAKNGSAMVAVVAVPSNATETCVIEGFTITEGDYGAILCLGSPTISHNVIHDNHTYFWGAILAVAGSTATIVNNLIYDNTNDWSGGGGIGIYGSPTIVNNTIADNDGLSGGGIYCQSGSPVIANNVIAFNKTGCGIWVAGGDPTLYNNNVYGNTDDSEDPCNYYNIDPGEDDISMNPLFVDRANEDYHIVGNSPCMDHGSNNAPDIPDLDIDMEERVDNDVVDIGYDEFDLGSEEEVCLNLNYVDGCAQLITLPGRAVDPDPWEVFDELRPPNKAQDLLSGNLHRYDAVLNNWVTYWHSNPTPFGQIYPGAGYSLTIFDDETICYDARVSYLSEATYFWPGEQWHLMGCPQTESVWIGDTEWDQYGDGPELFDDIKDVWVQDPLFHYDCDELTFVLLGLKVTDDEEDFRPFWAYWMYAFEANLVMVAPPGD